MNTFKLSNFIPRMLLLVFLCALQSSALAVTYAITPNPATVDEGAGTLTFTITRSGGTPAETIYASTTTGEGYANNSDYAGILNQAVSFTSGQVSRTVTVTILNDTTTENNETFGFIVQRNSSDPVSTYLAKSTFTITDNDPQPTTYAISPNPATVSEAVGTFTFTITRSGGTPAETIYASTTQTEGFSNSGDYTGIANQAVSFTSGQTTRTVAVAITDDTTMENNETFGFIVQRNSSDPLTTYLAKSAFTVTDNDPQPSTYTITPNPATVSEGVGSFTFTITRSGGAPAETIYASTTQTEGYVNSSDYAGIANQAVSFSSGQLSATVTVTVTNDTTAETSETFGFIVQRNSSDPLTTYLAKSTFTITDNDGGSSDYVGATWIPAADANQGVANRSFSDVRWIVIHTTEGTTASAIARFQNPAEQASAHYIVSRDGSIIQMVHNKNVSYGCGNLAYNNKCINIEHERYGTSDCTEIQYQASANLVKWLMTQFNVSLAFPSIPSGVAPADPTSGSGIIGHIQVPDPSNPILGGGASHHTDPVNWDWPHYETLIQGTSTPCTLGSPYFGLTIVTHGWRDNSTHWVTEMANSINCRMGGDIPIHTLTIVRSGVNGAILSSSLPQINDIIARGAGILLINWSDAATGACAETTPPVPTWVIGDLINNFLVQNDALLKLPIHLVGHSRGASVNSRLAKDLAASGIWVEQMTMLDPRPLPDPLGCPGPNADFEVLSWDNVLFADNYYQDSLVGGIPVSGTYQSDLSNIVTGDGYDCNFDPILWFDPFYPNGIAHNQIHAYYHGTVSVWCSGAPSCADGINIPSSWYESPNPGGWRRQTGFYFSRTGGGDRYGDQAISGLHYRFSGSSQNRQTVPLTSVAWPNATLKPLANYNYPANSPINFTYFYQDADSSMDIAFSLDNDTNPFNNSGNSCYRQIGSRLNNATSSIISGANTFSWTPGNADAGTAYVQIKATDAAGRVRYDYLSKPINILATGQALSDLVIQNLSVTPNTGEPGGTATVSFTIKNTGSGIAYPSSANIRLNSSSTGVTVSDTPLVIGVDTPSLPPNGTYFVSQVVMIPQVAFSGTYFVWIIVDVNNEANQSDTSNASDKVKFPITISIPAVPTAIGDYVQVYATGSSGLRVRSPNVCDVALVGGNHFDGAQGRVIDGPQLCTISGVTYTFWKIQWSDCVIGWSAQDWLRKIPSGTISCGSAPVIGATSPLPAGTVGLSYSQSLQATGGSTPYTWSIVSGSLPPGLILNSGSGNISGSPTTANSYTFRIRVTGSDNLNSEKDFILTVSQVSYNVTPSAGVNGNINPSTSQSVSGGGSVSFTATPNANYVVNQWLVDGSVVQSGGASYTLSNIQADRSVQVTFTYVPSSGALQVNLAPAGAVSAGAQWQVDGGAWQNSGATVSSLSVGNHTVSFKMISGWATPANQTPAITANQTTTATGTYVAVVGNPPQLSACSISNGVFHFTLNGPVGTNYMIEASSNLVNWTILSTNTIPANGAVNITNPVQPNLLRRFYRAQPVSAPPSPTRIILLSGDLVFSSVLTGSVSSSTITISNIGNSPLTISNITYPAGFSGNWNSGTILAGNSQNVIITFAPTTGADYYGPITVNSDKTSGSSTLNASGTGIIPVKVTLNTTGSGSGFFTVDGIMTGSGSFYWIPGSCHTIQANPSPNGSSHIQVSWAGWSDYGANSHMVCPMTNTTYTAIFTMQCWLAINAGPGGSVSPISGWYNYGQPVVIRATPSSGHIFTGWSTSDPQVSGTYTGTNNPATVIVNTWFTETAAFMVRP
ncbi:MAG: Calx-beta domain-containing protein [Limisphaerales bacterium]